MAGAGLHEIATPARTPSGKSDDAGDNGIRINAQTIEQARRSQLRLLVRAQGAHVLWALMEPAETWEGRWS